MHMSGGNTGAVAAGGELRRKRAAPIVRALPAAKALSISRRANENASVSVVAVSVVVAAGDVDEAEHPVVEEVRAVHADHQISFHRWLVSGFSCGAAGECYEPAKGLSRKATRST